MNKNTTGMNSCNTCGSNRCNTCKTNRWSPCESNSCNTCESLEKKVKQCENNGCNYCKLLRRRFMGQEVTIISDFLSTSGFIQESSFRDNLVKLFSQSNGGFVLATICCDQIRGILFRPNDN